MPFNITLVRSRIKFRPYAKIDGSYLGPTWNNNIGLQTVPEDPEGVFKIISALNTKHDTCMVMGTAIRPEIIDTDRTLKNFNEEPVRMLVLDLDKYVSPNMTKYGKEVTYFQAVEDADDFIKKYLPPEFHNTTYVIRFSASFLMKPDPYLRVHLTFILEDAQYPREIGMWLKYNKLPVDASFYFNLTQPIFTAAPVWRELVDPLTVRPQGFPRVGLVLRERHQVDKAWLPFSLGKASSPIDMENLPTAAQLPGKVGSFCRMVVPDKVLSFLGYTEESHGRFLAPNSATGVPGCMVFSNGYVFSHHSDDPVNTIVEKLHNFKRRSLNAYDILNGWAVLNRDTDPSIMREFEFLLSQAVTNDSAYQDEVQHELTSRAEWLTADGYEGDNRRIIDGIVRDMQTLGLSVVARDYVFNTVKAKTNGSISKQVLRDLWKNIRKDQASTSDAYDPDANLRQMAAIFKRQKLIYAYHARPTGDFWCYFGDTRMWKRCNSSQTKAFVYDHIHSSIPVKVEIDFTKMEHLTTLILRDACLHMANFRKGQGWAFRGGKYGLIMTTLFSDKQWRMDSSIKTLAKEDHIHKEMPITYAEWQTATSGSPARYIDFLVSSCEEDMESVELLREYGGYVIGDSYYLHKMLILEGVPGSGKSIVAKVLQECLGPEFCAAVSIKGLANRFGLGVLPGKKLAVMSEARSIELADLHALVPILLKIVGQDYIDSEAKGKDAMSELLECKILMMTNRAPVIPDDTGALVQRLMIARFDKGFRGTDGEILGLDRLIVSEGLAPIIRWHLQGLENLSDRKRFVESNRGMVALQGLTEQIDPLKTFIQNYFYVDERTNQDQWISQATFLRLLRGYMKRIGQNTDTTVVQKRGSIRCIKSLFPIVDKTRLWRGESRIWCLQYMAPLEGLDMEFVEELSELE